ncbi:MAG: RNA polymerase Rpb4 family protein [Candidatus Bathyarchaeia archaeon]
MPRKIIFKQRIPIPIAKKILEGVDEAELGEFQRRTLEYTRKFSKISPEKSNELLEELIKKFQLEESIAVQLVNSLPKTIEEIRSIVAVKGRVATSDQLISILELIKKFEK